MKIIITESQYQDLTEKKLREFLYGFWDKQKKHGEEPSLDDMLFRVLDINKNTRFLSCYARSNLRFCLSCIGRICSSRSISNVAPVSC